MGRHQKWSADNFWVCMCFGSVLLQQLFVMHFNNCAYFLFGSIMFALLAHHVTFIGCALNIQVTYKHSSNFENL